jgi:methylenetetrahydrofolate dehydrogenase (NADP+)/methenyltetrahydrofolate cyclohydrolase
MPATILDGRALGRKIRDEVRLEVDALAKAGVAPALVSLQVGESEPSRAYLSSQKKACAEAGILYTNVTLDANTTERQFLAHVDGISKNPEVTGLIIQLPVPARLDVRAAYKLMDPLRDVEGVHPANMGALFAGQGTSLQPCTARAVLEIVRSSGATIAGKEVVVVGHSQVVGKPIAALFLNEEATVTTCHAATRDLAQHTRGADILVVAAGKAGLVTGEMVKPGAVVVDVGINYVAGSDRPVGDVAFEEAAAIASAITPVPGGVGPVTVGMLLQNTVLAIRLQEQRRSGAFDASRGGSTQGRTS